MDKVQVKFGEWIEKGFNLYKKNFGVYTFIPSIFFNYLSEAQGTRNFISCSKSAGIIL